jgi:signal transduction histidine kinase
LSQQAEAQHLITNKAHAVKALTLILDNARKFTRPAEATGVSVGSRKERVTLQIEVANDQVCFIVEDTGIGVPPEEANHIFTEFVQLNEYYDGTGIGLSIARSLARGLHGDIFLDTTYTAGARFVLTLPINH